MPLHRRANVARSSRGASRSRPLLSQMWCRDAEEDSKSGLGVGRSGTAKEVLGEKIGPDKGEGSNPRGGNGARGVETGPVPSHNLSWALLQVRAGTIL